MILLTVALLQGPTIDLDKAEVKPGQTVTVRLAGWPAGNVAVELCGNGGRRGSADCAVGSSATTFVNAQGSGTVLLNVARPPVGCPCVVSVKPVGGGTARTVPITVKGAGTMSLSQQRAADARSRSLTVTSVRLEGSSIGAWFGGRASRTLVYTVRNDGEVTVADAPVSLSSGRSPDPTGILTAPALGSLEPGEERTYRVPVSFSAPAFGTYQVRGEIDGIERPVVFTGETSSYPWAWPFLGLLLAGATTVRRRRRPRKADEPGVTVVCPHCEGEVSLQLTAK
ncbi:hypothetical protein [Actinocorallia longicatena]|uniref:Uncharacterized protein n=1 Tax=Actinocorallia longicatena TaxID=111803 RepID=A0ABP6Q7T8_9ACTN